MQQLIDGAVLAGTGVVAPLALGPWRRWVLATTTVAVALALGAGPVAGAAAAPALVVAGVALVAVGRHAGPLFFWGQADVVRVLAAAWATVAAAALITSRLGLEPFGIHEPIVQLTAVHFLFAGTGAITLAGATGSRWAIVVTAAAPPFVALGFVSGWAVPQVGGAVLMAFGVFTIAALQLRAALTSRMAGTRRLLLAVSGLAVWAPMVLAVAWAAGQHWDVPALSIPAMVRWHGLPNAVGFVVAGLLASRIRTDASLRTSA